MKDYYAPPPGSRSGVADYAETLRRAMEPRGALPLPLYHLGNNSLHAEIYREAIRRPGVVVLHDAVLHHFLLGSLTREQYIEEFTWNYGEWTRELAKELWSERGSSGSDPRYFKYPMLRRAVERSRAVIVHNPGAAEMAREHGATQIHVIPHFFEPLKVDAAETALFRDRMGIAQGATLFGVFGYLRETKRVLPSIQAFVRLHESRPETALLISGDAVSPDLHRLLQIEANHPAIHRLPWLDEGGLLAAAAAVDCCINLRYPAAGETSGIAIRLMGMGKPVILSESDVNANIPAHACFRVTPGVAEPAELFDYMSIAAEFPGLARDVGRAAARHIAEFHSVSDVCGKYWQVLHLAVGTACVDREPARTA